MSRVRQDSVTIHLEGGDLEVDVSLLIKDSRFFHNLLTPKDDDPTQFVPFFISLDDVKYEDFNLFYDIISYRPINENEINANNIEKLLGLSDRFGHQDVRALCIEYLKHTDDVPVLTKIYVADKSNYDCYELIQRSFAMLEAARDVRQLEAFIGSEQFKRTSLETQKRLIGVFKMLISHE